MTTTEFWAAEAAKMRDTSHLGIDKGQYPTIEEIIKNGIQLSATFANLLKQVNVNLKNYAQHITFGKETATDPDGKITLFKNKDIKFQIIKLTHELSNKSQHTLFAAYTEKVSKGEITPKAYAIALAKIELKGEINQVKVASEIGYLYTGSNADALNELVKKYKEDTSIDLSEKVKAGAIYLTKYENMGIALRKRYQYEHPTIKFN